MQQFADRVHTVANAERLNGDGAPPVLLSGETGSGKGFVARMIHDIGPRSAQPFIELNCAALPDALLEAELFGYEKGAFPSGGSSKRGLFEAADGGTLFVDEIAHISLEIQAKLLHVIDTRSFRRLGSLAVRHTDLRIIASTSADLGAAVACGAFRAELFHRLNVLTLQLPPLRERGEDVLFLAEHFIEHHRGQYGLPPRRLSRDAKERLMLYHWPGNVRELASEIERALLLEPGDELQLADLARPDVNQTRAAIRADSGDSVSVELPPEGISYALIERSILERALNLCEGNVTKAARLLRLSRDTLRYRIERLGLKESVPSPSD
jgi:DNA-binding NtrC family response regulator